MAADNQAPIDAIQTGALLFRKRQMLKGSKRNYRKLERPLQFERGHIRLV
jgi:hypothetical protein